MGQLLQLQCLIRSLLEAVVIVEVALALDVGDAGLECVQEENNAAAEGGLMSARVLKGLYVERPAGELL